MNIQIFGTKKSADARKAERYFKERGIKFQYVDLKEKGLSKGELTSVMQAVGGLDRLIDEKAKDQATVTLLRYTAEEDKLFDIRRHIGMVFQNPDNQIVASVVEEDVAFALENMGVPQDVMRERVDEALKAVGMY